MDKSNVIGGIIIPQTSFADPWYCFIPGSTTLCAANNAYNIVSGDETTAGDKAWSIIKRPLEVAGKGLLEAIVFAMAFLGVIIFGTLANMMGGLFLWALSASTVVSYTHITGPDANLVVAAGWPMVRDLANMIIVLGFVVIGIATTLRIQEYQAKKLLPKLIIVALLINFSLLICGIFIDSSNIIIHYFSNAGGYLERSWSANVWKDVKTMWDGFDVDNATIFIGKAVGVSFQSIMMFIIYSLFF
ncbi:MAG: hypothetical protein HY219_01300, partial [Candidatus Staskawiczbacteria bacterium]|nr:hypothetical protein [Candidatus Staskawiczbacteria bacterium]